MRTEEEYERKWVADWRSTPALLRWLIFPFLFVLFLVHLITKVAYTIMSHWGEDDLDASSGAEKGGKS